MTAGTRFLVPVLFCVFTGSAHFPFKLNFVKIREAVRLKNRGMTSFCS
ncbi:hypothetical protein N786_10005 [Bacillus amyloliquefaciens UASWS BA1]|nr:hypothetical protein U722_14165 [Bacillus amyloliquefaciens LFB112]ERK83429.1 hypothetical protein N786_10005 [Bacillus amyloliquefaciens UASWS BA1]